MWNSTKQIATAKHRSVALLRMGTRKWKKYYSNRATPTPTDLVVAAKRRSCASVNGYEGVVKMLLGREDVYPNQQHEYGRTPLCCAARNGHEGVVKILLERDDVNPGKPDNDGQTPLRWAIQRGNAGVVALLQPGSSDVT